MPAFKDNAQNEWLVTIDSPTIEAAREELGIDLAGMDGTLYQRLNDDPCLLVNTIYLICREQAIARNVTQRDFAKTIFGDVIEHAAKALTDAIKSFFPTRNRELVSAVAEQNAKARELGITKALAKINDPKLMERVEAAMESEMNDRIERALKLSTTS